MMYIVIASYRAPSAPMPYAEAIEMVDHLRAQGIHAHAQIIER